MPPPAAWAALEQAASQWAPRLQPPSWLLDELRQRLVLLLNHVLQQEPEACARLKRQQGRVLLLRWRQFEWALQATPAGLLDQARGAAPADLTLTLTEASALALGRQVLAGQKPGVRIEGDVQLAAEINWLVDHVRWDLEDDLARLLGDVPAHWLVQAARLGLDRLRAFSPAAAPTDEGSAEGRSA